MKKFLALVFVLSSLFTNANNSTTTLTTGNKLKTTLTLDNVRPGQKLILKDLHGTIMYREPILHQGDYRRKFDLSLLPKGGYSFELDKGFAILIVPFNVDNSTLIFNEQQKRLILKPIISVDNHTIKVGKSPVVDYSVKVAIYYESSNDEVIYTDEISPSKKGYRAYTLLDNMPGNYRVVCETEGHTFTKHFKI
ncbi:hypothetical protein MWU59_13315 [Flavobacteriaceae bacterium F08102]|nr:hypothetical protein [Flavobacteriaceae bacterium F08102]